MNECIKPNSLKLSADAVDALQSAMSNWFAPFAKTAMNHETLDLICFCVWEVEVETNQDDA